MISYKPITFFVQRIGQKVYCYSPKDGQTTLEIIDAEHAHALHHSQQTKGNQFTIAAKVRVIGATHQLMVDGRNTKVADYMEALYHIRTREYTLSNPHELPETYRKMYEEIIDNRNN